jgi:hypothetical protein
MCRRRIVIECLLLNHTDEDMIRTLQLLVGLPSARNY